MSESTDKWYRLVHPGGTRGVHYGKEPKLREQDTEALPSEGYVVAFFPKLDLLGQASLDWPTVWTTLSRTPEAAIMKFMDGFKQGETWELYQDAGHCVRKIRISDLGAA